MATELYAIVSLPRSGSTALANIINVCRPASCANEPFNEAMYDGRYHALSKREGLERALLELRRNFDGFKHVWTPDGWPFSQEECALALNHEIIRRCSPLVILRRNNSLQRVISEEIARQTDIWITSDPQLCARRNSIPLQPIDPLAVASQIRAEASAFSAVYRTLNAVNANWMEVSYEQLYENASPIEDRISLLQEVLRFVGIRDWSNLAEMAMMSIIESAPWSKSESLYQCIPNIADLTLLGSEEFGWLNRSSS